MLGYGLARWVLPTGKIVVDVSASKCDTLAIKMESRSAMTLAIEPAGR